MIHGKAKQMFEEWYFKTHCTTSMKFKELQPYHKEEIFGWLYSSCDTIQNAFYIEFFDSIGIFIIIEFRVEEFYFVIKERKETLYSVCTQKGESKTRSEASQKAIEKSIELINSRL